LLLSALPKVLLSRATGMVTDIPLPRALRPALYRAFARRYGVDLGEVDGDLADFRTLGEFFRRPLREAARPIDAGAALVWPCDGRIVSSGPIREGRVPQVKGVDYSLSHLLVDGALAERCASGSQTTIYLAPGDYHRVHAPFAGQVLRQWHVPGGLFPVNPPARASVPDLFVRNERVVLECRLDDGRTGAVVMVAALNVGDIRIRPPVPRTVDLGEQLGAFGFGSTVIAVVEKGAAAFPELAPETAVRMGARAV
jgi:phosphatidylserine decarboxylase